MRTFSENDRNTLPRGWVRQAVMGVLRWKELPPNSTRPSSDGLNFVPHCKVHHQQFLHTVCSK